MTSILVSATFPPVFDAGLRSYKLFPLKGIRIFYTALFFFLKQRTFDLVFVVGVAYCTQHN